MAIKKVPLGMNVVEAARLRIRKLFENGVRVYLATSGGKDSIVLCDLLYRMCESGEVDKSLLTVQFCDEEVIYDEVVRVCDRWRKKFKLIGVEYDWYCIEHRNNNCFNALENNENFIPWDRFERANWSHEMPKFAIATNKYHRPRVESYQKFFERNNADGITIVGLRVAESQRRLAKISLVNAEPGCITRHGKAFPIYDWKDSDVWKYIKDNDVDFPDVYIKMYEAGIPKRNLRVCNFMAIDSCASLTAMAEAYPGLWEKVLRREPNAYLVRLYWDTEMFRRSTRKRRELEGADDKDYKALVLDIVKNPTKYFNNPRTLSCVRQYKRSIILKFGDVMDNTLWKKCYEGILGGDTKNRTLTALQVTCAKRAARTE